MTDALTVEQASEAVEHAEDMLRRAATYYGEVDGFDVVSDFERAVRRCPGHFTWPQRLLAQSVMMQAFLRTIGRC